MSERKKSENRTRCVSSRQLRGSFFPFFGKETTALPFLNIKGCFFRKLLFLFF